MSAVANNANLQQRRQRGVYYTPRALADLICARCLRNSELPHEVRLLDPACGDGVLLLAAFDQLCGLQGVPSDQPLERLNIVERQLFGMDLDAQAVDVARTSIARSVAGDRNLAPHIRRRLDAVLAANFRTGNALTEELLADRRPMFPEVAAAGGFDLVIGNPPYRRELNAKSLFDEVAAAPLGRWREPRMDYWYYFLHRGLDLLKPGGRLSFVVNAYWTNSTGARKLIARLREETSFEEVVLFGASPLFDGVQGQHLVFRLRKNGASGAPSAACRVMDVSAAEKPIEAAISGLENRAFRDERTACYLVEPDELFSRGQICLQPPDPVVRGMIAHDTLGDFFDVRQGIAENPPAISRKQAAESQGKWSLGEGVFVLNTDELAQLELSPEELRCLRPYYRAAMFARYRAPLDSGLSLIYSTPRTVPDLESLPQLRRHLARFRPLLETRREVRDGSIAWWHLHWPREERLFVEPRIVCLQMGRQPEFVSVERPTFVGFALNIIVRRAESPLSLPALTAILNSSLAVRWFGRHAKRRGVHLEINGHLLRDFPLPHGREDCFQELDRLSRQRHAAMRTGEEPKTEAAIDAIVNELYAIDFA